MAGYEVMLPQRIIFSRRIYDGKVPLLGFSSGPVDCGRAGYGECFLRRFRDLGASIYHGMSCSLLLSHNYLINFKVGAIASSHAHT